MAVTIKQVEATPEHYPTVEADMYGQAPDDVIWQRIEAYIAHRFTPRSVVWTVEGAGDWTPPLTPATLESVEVWDGAEWQEAFPAASPYGGYVLATDGPYRITATVGADGEMVGDVLTFKVPAVVKSAARRLNQYLIVSVQNDAYGNPIGGPDHWATSLRVNGDGEGAAERELKRPSTWIANAMQNSGAADLLRNFRRA